MREKILAWKAWLDRRAAAYDPFPQQRGTRIDFSPEERLRMMAQVREHVQEFFSGAPARKLDLAERENDCVDLDVAFWIEGELRASAILAERLPIATAIERCTKRAFCDGRFRPVASEELPALRIELTFFGSPWTQLSSSEERENVIDPERGYVAILDGRPVAWYLPTVHNAVAFRDLRDLVRQLLYSKGGLSRKQGKRAVVHTFPVVGWIESAMGDTLRELAGPVMRPDRVSSTDIANLLESSLAWIFHQEIVPGIFLPKQTLYSGGKNAIDWARLAALADVLAEIGNRSGRSDCRSASERIQDSLRPHLEQALFLNRETLALTAAYLGQAALSLGNAEGAVHWAKRSLDWSAGGRLSSVARLQIATLQARLGGPIALSRAESLWLDYFNEWEQQKSHAQLAAYPQLLPLGLELFRQTGKSRYHEQALAVGDWLVRLQNPDGSFPLDPKKNLPYVRGTGKIIEVLALFTDRYQEPIRRGFGYVAALQYTPDSLYHIPEARHGDFLGGYRHDVFNREAWLDAAAHVVLGAARYLDIKRDGDAFTAK